MQLLGIASAHKSDSLSNCCISCLLNTFWLLQSRVLKNPSQSLGKSFRTSTIFEVCCGEAAFFLQKRHLGVGWGGSGMRWSLEVTSGGGLIFFFLTLQTEALVGRQCGGLQGPSGRKENYLLICHCKQNWGLLVLKGTGDAAVSHTLGGQRGARETERGGEVCSRGPRGLEGQGPCAQPGAQLQCDPVVCPPPIPHPLPTFCL